MNNTWTNVKDKLPEIVDNTSKFVMVYDKNHGILIAYLYKNKAEFSWILKEIRFHSQPYLSITHWKLMPPSPTEEQKELQKIEEQQNWIIKIIDKISNRKQVEEDV